MKTQTLLFLFCTSFLFGQELPYTFYISTQDFEELSDATSLNNGEIWDENSYYPVFFSFDFKVNDQDYSSINVQARGIQFVGQGSKRLSIFHSPFGGAIIKDKGETGSLSPISYKEVEIDENKVLIIEWQNAGFRDTPSNTVDEDDFVTYQVWLVENLNLIKIVYGPSHSSLETYSNSGGSQGPFTKLLIDGITVTPIGLAGNPSYEFEDCTNPCYGHVTGTPPENIVYNFSLDMESANHSVWKEYFMLYPNPSNDGLFNLETSDNFDPADNSIFILDSKGIKIPFDYSRNGNNIQLDLSNSPIGVYFIIIKNSKGDSVFNHKILKI